MTQSAPKRGGSAARIVLPVVELAASYGHNPADICRAAGIGWHELQTPDATISSAAVARLCLHVQHLIGEPNLGLRLASGTGDLSRFDPGMMMMMACSCLRESLQRLERLQVYWADGYRVRLVEVPGGMCLRHEPAHASTHTVDPALGRHADESALAKAIIGIRTLTSTHARPRGVRFRHAAPPDIREHVALFDCEIQFGATHSELELSRELLDAPLPHANETYRQIFQSQVEQALARLPAQSGLAQEVRDAAQAALVSGRCSLAHTASALGISTRTLQRRLQSEGTSFEELTEALRRELAEIYLAQDTPIQEIAWQLGYSTASAFHHAFKRWTGRTPEQARAQRSPVEAGE